MKPSNRHLFPLIAGVLLALAFPKFGYYGLAWGALIPFLLALRKCPGWKQAAMSGLFFGIAFFALNSFWLLSLFRFVGFWIVLGYGAATLFQALFILGFALSFYASRKFNFQIVIVPLLWVAWEWLRAAGPFGSTFGVLGYSQAALLPLIQICSFTSVYGISFLLVMSNQAWAEIIETRKITPLLSVIMLVVISLLYGQQSLNQPLLAREHLRLAIIQPNIDQMRKMDARYLAENYEIHERLTRSLIEKKPQLIIWPETTLFSYLLRDRAMFEKVSGLARETGAYLIIGTPHYEPGKIYNSVAAISPSGEAVVRYDKQHLVPFGEYLPFRPILFPLLKNVGYYDQQFSSNPNPSNLLAGKTKIATAICFESMFPDLIRERVRLGADFILTVTNDSWFGDSAAAYQHLSSGVFRAIENRRYFVQAGNTGISAVIDPWGRMIERSRLNEEATLSAEIALP
jgi:apolipoprotein N-acyltransferase